ncbi:MAG: anhydro-N-acetylmuramic acid kinase, partial [Planctomycetota bacterium]
MTGTSLDGADAALVRLAGRGQGMSAVCVAHEALPLEAGLRERLRAMADGEPATASAFAEAARGVGR